MAGPSAGTGAAFLPLPMLRLAMLALALLLAGGHTAAEASCLSLRLRLQPAMLQQFERSPEAVLKHAASEDRELQALVSAVLATDATLAPVVLSAAGKLPERSQALVGQAIAQAVQQCTASNPRAAGDIASQILKSRSDRLRTAFLSTISADVVPPRKDKPVARPVSSFRVDIEGPICDPFQDLPLPE